MFQDVCVVQYCTRVQRLQDIYNHTILYCSLSFIYCKMSDLYLHVHVYMKGCME